MTIKISFNEKPGIRLQHFQELVYGNDVFFFPLKPVEVRERPLQDWGGITSLLKYALPLENIKLKSVYNFIHNWLTLIIERSAACFIILYFSVMVKILLEVALIIVQLINSGQIQMHTMEIWIFYFFFAN